MIDAIRENLRYRKNGTLFHVKRGIVLRGTKSNASGHLRMRVGGHLLYVHQAVFAIHHGRIPAVIDHVDRNPANNRIENLREVSHSENSLNVGASRRNTSGIRGLYFDRRDGKWYGQTMVRGKVHSTKRFADKREAARAIVLLRARLGIL